MTNINAFYPQRLKGWALGLNAGGGNIGVPAIQLVGLFVIWVASDKPEILCAIYLVLLAVAGVGAALYMDNLDHQTSSGKAMLETLKYKDTWIISLLYVGTFGSFIGFGFAFSQVLNISFTANGATKPALAAAQIAWIGPLLGSISRPYGGKLADKIGGGKITMYCFISMVAASSILVAASALSDANDKKITGGTLTAFVIGFVLLFVISGIANGSVYKIIPAIWEHKAKVNPALNPLGKANWSRSMSGALIGIAGAFGGLGGVAINLVLRDSYKSNQSATQAFWIFLAFYVVAAGITYWFYVRRSIESTDKTRALEDSSTTTPVTA
jgi:NNP family nitrate/nitrite transporter-like MFS transporter